MKNLIVVIFVLLSYCSVIYSQNENDWLEHSYLQINAGQQYDQLVGAYYTIGELGYYIKGPKSVFGGSASIANVYKRTYALDAKLKYGRYLSNPENKNWNLLAMTGLAYIKGSKTETWTRTGIDDQGQPIFDVDKQGGKAFGLPISLELQSNKINRSGFNIRIETLITTGFDMFYSLTAGVNIKTK